MGRKAKDRWIHTSGYVVLSDGGSGQYEHRVVAAQKLGRELLSNEDVHHLNEIKTDNQPDNLEVKLHAEHTRLHHPKQLVNTVCGFCGKPLEVSPCKIAYSKSGKVFCDSNCSGKHNNGQGVRGRPFTEQDDATIVALRKLGKNYNQIAKATGRNRESIRTRILKGKV